MTLKTGHIVQNRYRIAKLVGQGGFGAVYRAWDLNVNQPVALKENLATEAEAQRQFEREATLLAGLRHPSLPRVTDHFVIPDQGQYLVMDFVEGQSLGDLLNERGGPLTEAEALPWMRQVCDALSYLHARTPPIIHRDIKPDNIIIGSDGRAVLVDFGISKVFEADNRTTVGAKAITPGYSPPEQYGLHSTDGRSDIYALAATLYRVLTGQMPPESVVIMAAGVRLTPAHEINPAVSPATAAAITRGMAPLMAERTGSAAEFAATLTVPAQGHALVGGPVAAPLYRAPALEPLAPKPDANPPAAAPRPAAKRSDGGGASLLLLVAGMALSLGLFRAVELLGFMNIDYRIVLAARGFSLLGFFLAGVWGGPWLGALAGALAGVVLVLFDEWEWAYVLVLIVMGLIAGLLARRGWARSFVGAAVVGLLAGFAAVAVEKTVAQVLFGSTSIDVPLDLSFLAGVIAAGVLVWLLARLIPRAWLRRLPLGDRVR